MMLQSSSPQNSFSLAVGGLGVRLDGTGFEWRSILQPWYASFRVKNTPDFFAHIDFIKDSRQEGFPLPDFFFQDGILHFGDPWFSGWIDSKEKKGYLTLQAAQPAAGVEYFLRFLFALLAFDSGGFLMHSAGLVRRESAYLFFGHSGSGKTTVARLSAQDRVLNDDLILLRPSQKGWMAYGTPFWNQTQVKPRNLHAPLAGLFRLVQSKQVFLEKLNPAQSLAEVLSSIPILSKDPSRNALLIERMVALIEAIPVMRLHFLPDDTFWQVVDSREQESWLV